MHDAGAPTAEAAGAAGAAEAGGAGGPRPLLPSLPDPSRRWPVTRADLTATLVFAVAGFALRYSLVASSPGGLAGNLGDDGAAYYAGADAMVHGRMPYRDFVLLHPPLLDVVLTPFALFGALTSDHVGFIAASVAFQVLGGVNAALVVVVARRFGLVRFASYLAGAFYAGWFGAVAPDDSIRLETLASTVTLLGLLALTGVDRRRNLMLAGAAFGAAASVKIWGVVPALVLVLWWLAHRRTRGSVPALLAGMAAAVVVVCGPFFVLAPVAMARMIVRDQLDRGATPRGDRLDRLTGIPDVLPTVTGHERTVLVAVACVCVLALVVCAAWSRAAQLPVALLASEVAVLWYSPSYFSHYEAFLAVALALTVGAAAQAVSGVPGDRVRMLVGRATATFAVVASVSLAVHAVSRSHASLPFPTARVKAALAGAHCPTPDGPMALIQSDQLSSTLGGGCPNWVDVSGRVYDVDRAPQGPGLPRSKNVRWQRALKRYLLSGDAIILFRPGLGIGPKLRRQIDRLPLLVDSDGVVVRRVRPYR